MSMKGYVADIKIPNWKNSYMIIPLVNNSVSIGLLFCDYQRRAAVLQWLLIKRGARRHHPSVDDVSRWQQLARFSGVTPEGGRKAPHPSRPKGRQVPLATGERVSGQKWYNTANPDSWQTKSNGGESRDKRERRVYLRPHPQVKGR